MSKRYIGRIKLKFILNPIDKIWNTLIDSVGREYILDVRKYPNIDYSEDLVDYTAFVELGCGGGVDVQNALNEVVNQLNENEGLEVCEASVYSLHLDSPHPDKIEAKYSKRD